MLQSLRRAGGSLVMTVPKAFIEQNNLHYGSQVNLFLEGDHMTITAKRNRYSIVDLMSEMPNGLPRIDNWDDMPSIGLEGS